MRYVSSSCSFLLRGGVVDQPQHRAVRRPEISFRRAPDQLRRHLAEFLLEAIYARRVIVEQRERGEQVGAAEAGEHLDLGVERGALLDERALQRGLVDL